MEKIKNQKGITIVSLIITVIILTILATITVTSIKASGNIGPYNKMVADITLLEDKLLVFYNKNGYIPIIDDTEETINGIKYNKIDLSKLSNITLNFGFSNETDDYYLVNNGLKVYYKKGIEKSGVLQHKISDHEDVKNNYNFYFNKQYVCNNYYQNSDNTYAIIVFYEDGSSHTIVHEEMGLSEGSSISLLDAVGSEYYYVDSLEYNHEYTGTGSLNETYTGVVDSNGSLTTNVYFPSGSAVYSQDSAIVGGMINVSFSNNGRQFTLLGRTYVIIDYIV